MSSYQPFKHQVVETARQLTEQGYLMATGGNLSIRIAGQPAFAITPSNFDYLKMQPGDVCILDFDLKLLEGELAPSV
jgi:ribulose-5-phosphate 4-epimerase/fuculose-1-phosphate aldolase